MEFTDFALPKGTHDGGARRRIRTTDRLIANLLMYFLDQKVMQTRCNDGAVKARRTPLCEISQKLEDFLDTFSTHCVAHLWHTHP